MFPFAARQRRPRRLQCKPGPPSHNLSFLFWGFSSTLFYKKKRQYRAHILLGKVLCWIPRQFFCTVEFFTHKTAANGACRIHPSPFPPCSILALYTENKWVKRGGKDLFKGFQMLQIPVIEFSQSSVVHMAPSLDASCWIAVVKMIFCVMPLCVRALSKQV